MMEKVNYAFEDEEVGEVARKIAEWQVYRLPVLNRDKELVGIVSLGDIALEGKDRKSTARAAHGIARPTAQHRQ
jgi:CBS-domain-containing membrane protein